MNIKTTNHSTNQIPENFSADNTEFIQLTDLWNEGEYSSVGRIIAEESWASARVAEFCAYFTKYLGVNQLNILYKFL
tara:strand:- start:4493 stop:4723 length:231 start_codon:yes stop_codon:yes gene_type:complete